MSKSTFSSWLLSFRHIKLILAVRQKNQKEKSNKKGDAYECSVFSLNKRIDNAYKVRIK